MLSRRFNGCFREFQGILSVSRRYEGVLREFKGFVIVSWIFRGASGGFEVIIGGFRTLSRFTRHLKAFQSVLWDFNEYLKVLQ